MSIWEIRKLYLNQTSAYSLPGRRNSLKHVYILDTIISIQIRLVSWLRNVTKRWSISLIKLDYFSDKPRGSFREYFIFAYSVGQ